MNNFNTVYQVLILKALFGLFQSISPLYNIGATITLIL